jgi:hypothetical protein
LDGVVILGALRAVAAIARLGVLRESEVTLYVKATLTWLLGVMQKVQCPARD